MKKINSNLSKNNLAIWSRSEKHPQSGNQQEYGQKYKYEDTCQIGKHLSNDDYLHQRKLKCEEENLVPPKKKRFKG